MNTKRLEKLETAMQPEEQNTEPDVYALIMAQPKHIQDQVKARMKAKHTPEEYAEFLTELAKASKRI